MSFNVLFPLFVALCLATMSSSASPRRKNEIDVIKQNLHGLVRSHKPVKYHDGNDDPVVSDFSSMDICVYGHYDYLNRYLLSLSSSLNLYFHFSQ